MGTDEKVHYLLFNTNQGQREICTGCDPDEATGELYLWACRHLAILEAVRNYVMEGTRTIVTAFGSDRRARQAVLATERSIDK
jgi:hypothetical protein